MKPHRLAKYFPLLEGEEFDLLVESIRKNGQLEPIVTIDGKILDGVNRALACEKLGIDFIANELKDIHPNITPLDYVISENIRRRHMDTSQRAMLATEMLPELEEEAKGRKGKKTSSPTGDEMKRTSQGWAQSVEQAGEIFGVGGRSISRAKAIKEEAPEKVKDIVDGKTTITAVDTELRKKKAAERATELKEKADDKEVKLRPRIVADYIDLTKKFKDGLQLAIAGAKRDRFAPEAMQFIEHRHGEIRELMNELEELNER